MATHTELPKTMQAQVLEAYKEPYQLRTVSMPRTTDSNDLLIKVEAASYCHTDHVLSQGQMPGLPPNFPHIGCHEFAGKVISHHSSPSSQALVFQVGDKVGVPGRAFHPCERCFECQTSGPNVDGEGYSVYCPHALNNGISRDGGFAEYAVVDARQVAPVLGEMTSVETAPLMCAGLTIYAALKKCGLKEGDRVGVVGAGGGLGHLGLQFAVAMGLRVVGVEAADGPLSLAKSVAKSFGAGERTRIVDSREESAEDLVAQLGTQDSASDRGQQGVDAVIVLPESQGAFEYAIKLLKNHGVCVIVSFPEKGFHISAHDIVFRDISVIGSLVGSNACLREMLRFSAEHRIRAVAKTYPLSGLNELVEQYHEGDGGKSVLDMSLGN
jgi:D-arabinose 1-dehydrogenase-like Zn-dependent alcohol dehydrogenase